MKESSDGCSPLQLLVLPYAGLQYVGPRVQACQSGAAHAAHADYFRTLHQADLRDSNIHDREKEGNDHEVCQENHRGDCDTRRKGSRRGFQKDDNEHSRHRAGEKNGR